jgi:hypothetical protein
MPRLSSKTHMQTERNRNRPSGTQGRGRRTTRRISRIEETGEVKGEVKVKEVKWGWKKGN